MSPGQENQENTQSKSLKICPTCNKRMAVGDAPSLTQWIFSQSVCQCKQQDGQLFENQIQQSATSALLATFCKRCRKRIVEKVAGSITQWIFQSHQCSCENPDPITIEQTPQEERIEIESNELSLPYEPDEEISENWLEELKRYIPIKLLGDGASGSVYMCFDKSLQKIVAIKILKNRSEEMIVSFQGEAKATSKLNHESIVKVLDFGVTKRSTPYLVMEYADGVNLAEHIEMNGQLSIEHTVSIAKKLSDALEHAHGKGILHRDIKSTNIIIGCDPDGELHPVLIDFGVAKFKQDDEEKQSETMVGSASYMAPDYITSKKYTEQSEIYSFGIVLYECFTGRVPFLGKNLMETLYMHSNEIIKKLGVNRADLQFPEELEEFMVRCLAKDLAIRFKNFSNLKETLNNLNLELEKNEKVLAPVVKTLSKKSAYSPALYAVLVAACLAGVISWMLISNKSEDVSIKETAKQVAKRQQQKDQRWFPEEKEPFRKVNSQSFGKVWRPRDLQNVKDEEMKWLVNKEPLDLKLSGSAITGSGLKYVKDWPIRRVLMGNSAASDAGLVYVNEFNSLMEIVLNSTEVTDKGIASLYKQKNLESFDVRNCAKVTNKSLKPLIENNPKISRLRLSHCGATREICYSIGKLQKLSYLTVESLKLDDKALAEIANCKLITHLNIAFNPDITDKGITFILKLPKLQKLTIYACPKVSDKIIAQLKRQVSTVKHNREITPIENRMDAALEFFRE